MWRVAERSASDVSKHKWEMQKMYMCVVCDAWKIEYLSIAYRVHWTFEADVFSILSFISVQRCALLDPLTRQMPFKNTTNLLLFRTILWIWMK